MGQLVNDDAVIKGGITFGLYKLIKKYTETLSRASLTVVLLSSS